MTNLTFPETSVSFMTALFNHPRNAESVYRDLLQKGYKKEDITLIMSEETQKKYFSDETAMKDLTSDRGLQKMGVGGVIGGTIGTLIASLTAVIAQNSIINPGISTIVIVAFIGASMGVVLGELIASLLGADAPKVAILQYDQGVKEGGVIIGVVPLESLESSLQHNKWVTSDDE